MILAFIKQFNFLEIFRDVGGVNLSEKCVNVSCCIVLVSNVSKIRHDPEMIRQAIESVKP